MLPFTPTLHRFMKLTYDPEFNIAYLQLKEKSEQVRTIQVSDQLNVDLSDDGTIFGIELLNANEQLGGSSRKELVFQNDQSGKSACFALPF